MNLNMEAVCHDTWCWAEREINLLRRLIVLRSWIAAAPLDLDRQIPKTFRTSQLFFKEFFSKKLFANFKLIRFDTNKNITINSNLLFKKREKRKKETLINNQRWSCFLADSLNYHKQDGNNGREKITPPPRGTIYLRLKAERKWVFESVPKTSRNEHRQASARALLRGKSVGKGEDVFLRIVEVANGGKKRRLQPATLRCSTVTGLQFPQTERERGHSRVTQTLIRHPILEPDLIEPVCALRRVPFNPVNVTLWTYDRKE